MTDATLEQRFALALRRALDGAQPGAVSVDVAAPHVTVTPVIRATLPALTEPVLVEDVARWAGAWRYRLDVKRDGAGFIQTVDLQPTRFMTAEEIQNER